MTHLERLTLKPVAWMRRWYFEGEVPMKERKENWRMAWPYKFKLLPVTTSQCLPDDVPLFHIEKSES